MKLMSLEEFKKQKQNQAQETAVSEDMSNDIQDTQQENMGVTPNAPKRKKLMSLEQFKEYKKTKAQQENANNVAVNPAIPQQQEPQMEQGIIPQGQNTDIANTESPQVSMQQPNQPTEQQFKPSDQMSDIASRFIIPREEQQSDVSTEKEMYPYGKEGMLGSDIKKITDTEGYKKTLEVLSYLGFPTDDALRLAGQGWSRLLEGGVGVIGDLPSLALSVAESIGEAGVALHSTPKMYKKIASANAAEKKEPLPLSTEFLRQGNRTLFGSRNEPQNKYEDIAGRAIQTYASLRSLSKIGKSLANPNTTKQLFNPELLGTLKTNHEARIKTAEALGSILGSTAYVNVKEHTNSETLPLLVEAVALITPSLAQSGYQFSRLVNRKTLNEIWSIPNEMVETQGYTQYIKNKVRQGRAEEIFINKKTAKIHPEQIAIKDIDKKINKLEREGRATSYNLKEEKITKVELDQQKNRLQKSLDKYGDVNTKDIQKEIDVLEKNKKKLGNLKNTSSKVKQIDDRINSLTSKKDRIEQLRADLKDVNKNISNIGKNKLTRARNSNIIEQEKDTLKQQKEKLQSKLESKELKAKNPQYKPVGIEITPASEKRLRNIADNLRTRLTDSTGEVTNEAFTDSVKFLKRIASKENVNIKDLMNWRESFNYNLAPAYRSKAFKRDDVMVKNLKSIIDNEMYVFGNAKGLEPDVQKARKLLVQEYFNAVEAHRTFESYEELNEFFNETFSGKNALKKVVAVTGSEAAGLVAGLATGHVIIGTLAPIGVLATTLGVKEATALSIAAQRMAVSPTLRKYYSEMLRASSTKNKDLLISSTKKFIEGVKASQEGDEKVKNFYR